MLAIIISTLIVVALVVFDQLSKYWIVSSLGVTDQLMQGHDHMEALTTTLDHFDIIPGVLRFKLVVNDGAMMGFFDDARWVYMTLSVVAIVAIFVYLYWKKPQDILQLSSLTLIVAGGIGNMFDRTGLGYVIDFIDFYAVPTVWKWTFNVADSCVTVGAVMLALWMIIDLIKESKKKKAVEAVSNDSAEANAAEIDVAEAEESCIEEAAGSETTENIGKTDGEADGE